jgi:hypothetical protein
MAKKKKGRESGAALEKTLRKKKPRRRPAPEKLSQPLSSDQAVQQRHAARPPTWHQI